jgi:hypothetical protein
MDFRLFLDKIQKTIWLHNCNQDEIKSLFIKALHTNQKVDLSEGADHRTYGTFETFQRDNDILIEITEISVVSFKDDCKISNLILAGQGPAKIEYFWRGPYTSRVEITHRVRVTRARFEKFELV